MVWKYGILSSISFLKFSIPFWHLSYSVPKFPFHSIPFSIPYHALVFDLLLLLLLQNFTPTVVARLKIRKRLILKKLLTLPAPFQHFRFRVRFRFQPLLSQCFRFHKKLTASASTSLVKKLLVEKREEGYEDEWNNFLSEVANLYRRCLEYLCKWMKPMEELAVSNG